MVLTELLLKIPYSIAWRLANNNNAFPVVFYCSDYLDYLIFEPIRKYLPEMTIVAKNRRVQELLFEKGVSSILFPVYPKAVIMARHAYHMFPSSKILKIGLRHGPYHFKNFIKPEKYNKFDKFYFTSQRELDIANEIGVINGDVGGFPKIDELHNNSITEKEIIKLKEILGFNNNKPILLFSGTWNKSELSAIDKWYDQLHRLKETYNLLVTVHPFTDSNYIERIKETDGVCFIENENLNPYIQISDLLVSDTSSIIAEFNSLCKPIITFRVDLKGRLNPFIVEMLDQISFRVNDMEDLISIIPESLEKKNDLTDKQKKYNKILFAELDGKSGERTAKKINDLIHEAGISFD